VGILQIHQVGLHCLRAGESPREGVGKLETVNFVLDDIKGNSESYEEATVWHQVTAGQEGALVSVQECR